MSRVEKNRRSVPLDEVRRILRYDPETGKFTWLVRVSIRACAGDEAGSVRNQYCVIGIRGRTYGAHQLAFLYMTGVWPDRAVDHKDGDSLNNKWSNLRLATPTENSSNRKLSIRNKSGYKGVFRDKKSGRWHASIKAHGRSYYLGSFLDPKEAHEAYRQKAVELVGEFARFA